MNTDQNSIKSANDLLLWLDVQDINLRSCDVHDLMSFVWTFVTKIWYERDDDSYTDHGIEHSKSIIGYFLKLKPIYEWTKYESVVFAISALIHDIGMQYNKFSEGYRIAFQKYATKLSQDEIRKLHAELGFELIQYEIKLQAGKHYPNDIVARNTILDQASYIAASHSENKYLRLLIKGKPQWRERQHLRYFFRPRLLAGILRICDQLDADFCRLIEPDKILNWNLNKTTKLHWYACLFIESVETTPIDNVINIRYNLQVPENSTDDQIKSIKYLLAKLRESKLRGEINVINNFYERCGELQHIRTFNIKPISSGDPARIRLAITPNEFSKFLKDSLKDIDKVKIIDSLDLPISKDKLRYDYNRKLGRNENNIIDTTPYKKNIVVLETELKNWLEKNKIVDHFELLNGEHTDTYIYCRTLISDPNLLLEISEYMYNCHKNHKINRILAVGTSAIPIVSILSYRLQCSATFTMFNIRDLNYYPNEVYPILKDRENILVIDDIISGGKVAEQILNLVVNEMKIKIGNVYHQAIFRLGNRDYLHDPRIKDYYYIIHEPRMMYAESSVKCVLCQQGRSCIYEKDI